MELSRGATNPVREGEAPAEPKSMARVPLSLFAHNRSLSIPDARDESRLRPSNRLQLIEKYRVFAVRGRAGMLGLHFSPSASGMLGLHICPLRHSCPAACCPDKAKKRCTAARRSAIPWADNHSAKRRFGFVPQLVLGGRSMGFSPCRPQRLGSRGSRRAEGVPAVV
jgi:hypothetical protein